MPKLSKKLGGGDILVKDEARLPTGSFKARGPGHGGVDGQSARHQAHGDADQRQRGRALAAYASHCGVKTTIFCPEDTPEVNVSEIALQGAAVYRVNGLIDDCGKIVGEGKAKVGWFDTSTLKEPYRIEGKKTMGLELAEQLGWDRAGRHLLSDRRRHRPDRHVEGLRRARSHRLQSAGKRPRMIAVQASGCAPMVKAYEEGKEHAPRWENAHNHRVGHSCARRRSATF
ncbi:MAG: pyridoxal-phosphate dependent enzyme [Pseudolabrys sp.]